MSDETPPPTPRDPVIAARPIVEPTELESDRTERRALAVFAVGAIVAMIWIVGPVGIGILLGTLLGFSLQDTYDRSVRRHGREALVAAGYVFMTTAGLLTIIAGVSSLFVARGTVLTRALIESLEPEGVLREHAHALATLFPSHSIGADEMALELRAAVAALASRATSIATTVAMASYHVLLTLFFAMMTLAFVLRNWTAIQLRVEDMLPLHPRHSRALLDEFQRVGRTTLLGTILTGVAQGVFAGIGFWITGVPEAAFFGVATALASLVPGIGTMLVWLPAGVFLVATGHPAMGTLELVWSLVLVIGVSDYVIRPRLVGRGGEMPALLTFASFFGGVEVFGLAGLIVGPLVMSVAYAVLRIFALDAAERRRR